MRSARNVKGCNRWCDTEDCNGLGCSASFMVDSLICSALALGAFLLIVGGIVVIEWLR